jgi:hypothetical protein
MRLGLRAAVAQAPSAEAQYRCEAQPAEAGLKMAVDPVLREICGSDLRPILPARVGLVEVFVASVIPVFRPTRFCLSCLRLSTATETKLRQQSAARKVNYRY